jgi:hypothetical protein
MINGDEPEVFSSIEAKFFNIRPPIAGLSETTVCEFRMASSAALRQAVPLAQSAMEDLKHGPLTEFEKLAISI